MRNIAACAVVEDMFAWMLGSPKYAWRLDPAKNAEQFFLHRARIDGQACEAAGSKRGEARKRDGYSWQY